MIYYKKNNFQALNGKESDTVAAPDYARAGPARQTSQADCRAMFDAVSDAILIHDAQTGAILDVNQGMREMFGYTLEEARQLTLTALCGSEAEPQAEGIRSLLAQAAAGSPQVFEWQARDRAGRVFWVEVHLKPIRLAGGGRILAVLRDIGQHKRAEEALKESEARYRMVTEGSLAGVYVIQDRGFAYVNPTMAQIFGYQPEDFRNGAVEPRELIHPDDLPLVQENVRRRLSGELEAAHYTFRGRHRDGSVIYCESFGRAVEYRGRPAIVGTLLDITERQRAVEALQTHTRVLESMAEGVTVTDGDGKIIYSNPAFDAMFGYQPGELIGQQVSVLSDFSPSESVSFVQEMVGQLPTKRILSGEVRNRKKDGTKFYTQARISALEISGKTCWILVQEDITERKQFEDALRESEASYRIVTEGSLAGVYLIQDDKFRYVNPVLAQAFGYRPDEISDRLGPLDLVHPEDRSRVAGDMQRRLDGEGAGARNSFKGVRQDGSVIFCEVLTRQVEYQGRPAIMGTLLDITERRLAEEALKASFEELEGLVAERTAGLQAANVQLRREIEERRRTEAIIRLQRDLGLTLSGKVGLRETLRLCVETAIAISGLDSGGVYLIDPGSGDLDLAYHQGFSPEFGRRVSHYQADSLNTYLVMAGRPVYARLSDLPGIVDEEGLKEGLRSAAIIPVIHQGQVIAAINIASHHYEEVPATARAALETLAAQVGSAIARVQAEEALRRAKEDLETRVAERTAQWRRANELLEAELQVRRKIEQSLRQVSRALKAITECHQALIRATNEAELLNEVCRIIVEVGGYRMAWVGYAEQDADKSVRPVAQRGLDEGYVEQLQLTWADKERGRGPSGKAIRLGKPAICRDTNIDPDVAFAREEVRKRGYASILALPLKDGRTFGVLTIYASAPDAFDDEEVSLLMGLANDLAYGITALRARADQRRAEKALKESEQELRRLTARLLSIQEQERRRVARELHDELGQALTVLKIHLVAIEDKLSPDQEHLRANCEQMLSYIDTVIENVRRLSWDLSPSSLEDLGLSSALEYLVDGTCRDHNLRSTVAMDEIDHLFSPETQINIYRIFQESLTNVVKHAGASLIAVKVTKEDGKVSFTIRDNGRGFNLKGAISRKVPPQSLGLSAMNERALMAAGSLQISSRKGRGTTITFVIPTDKLLK